MPISKGPGQVSGSAPVYCRVVGDRWKGCLDAACVNSGTGRASYRVAAGAHGRGSACAAGAAGNTGSIPGLR